MLTGNDMRAASAGEGVWRLIEVRDDCAPAAAAHVPDRRLHLRRHAALAEMAGALVLAQLRDRYPLECARARRAVVDRDALDRGQDEQILDAERAREERRGQVLVDH